MEDNDYILQLLAGWNLPVILISALIIFLWVRSRRPRDLPPGPTPVPIIGNILFLLSGDVLSVTRKIKKYGSLSSLSVGPRWTIFLNDSEIIRKVFVKHADKFSDRPDVFFFTTLLDGKGISATSGQLWKTQKTFTLNALRQFGFGKRDIECKIIEEVGHFIKVLEVYKGNSICIQNHIRAAIANVICTLVFGKRFSYDDPSFLRLVNELDEILSNPYIPIVNWIPSLLWTSRIFDIFGIQKALRCVRDIKEHFAKLIEEHKKTFDKNNMRDFIDAYLLECQNRTSESQLIEVNFEAIVFELFAAATDTTASALGWAVLYLLHNPDVQEKMRAEMIDKVGFDEEPLMADKKDLLYCESVIFETLRLGNVSPLSIPHTTPDNMTIEGYRIPKGSIVVPNLNATMHDERFFPNSDKFDPNRYIDESGKRNGLRENLLPFSLGRRACLGESIAKMELFLFLTAIVRRYKIIPPEDEPVPNIKGRIGTIHSPVSFKVKFVDW